MSTKFFAERLYEAGYRDLLSVIPPGAQLVPSSTIDQSQLGKVPGRRLPNGLWAGYNWRAQQPTIDEVRQWCLDGANIGLRADHFAAVDIDCVDPTIAKIIAGAAHDRLGVAPARTGLAPKTLLMYRSEEPFGRLRLWFTLQGEQHLIEVLGQGQQYLVHGTHPKTMRPYTWDLPVETLPADGLTPITREMADGFLTYIGEELGRLGVTSIEREGDGKPITRTAGDQAGLLAPSMDELRAAVRAIPNTNDLFPSRTDYIRMGYAIRAAAPEADEPDAFAIFLEWAIRWEGNGRAMNDERTVRADWRRMRDKKSVGWLWIAEQARLVGHQADMGFEVTSEIPARNERPVEAPMHSDQWLADKVVAARGSEIRYVPQTGRWLVSQGYRWSPDAELLAEDIVKRELRLVADQLLRAGATEKEKAAAVKIGVQICSSGKATAVRQLLQSERAIAVGVDALDFDPWILNTPGGIVDLETGEVRPSDPDALCTKATSVPADFGGTAPRWQAFLLEAAGGDPALVGYLQRLAGYCLTGSTREQHLTFVYGPGGNGKSIFLNVLAGILGDYARTASMDTFTASSGDKHSTDIAMLVGARLVTASETQAGKRWDEAKVKALTGGEPISARFMRQDNFTFVPNMKLLFVGNHKPEIRDLDDALRRRIHLVPFTQKPAVVDRELGAKLREEWPAILAWMIEGCLAWQAEGLTPPAVVVDATQEYFDEEDPVKRWLDDCTTAGEGESTQNLFASWREWANRTGEFVGKEKRLASALVARGIERWREPVTRRMGFAGIVVKDRMGQGFSV